MKHDLYKHHRPPKTVAIRVGTTHHGELEPGSVVHVPEDAIIEEKEMARGSVAFRNPKGGISFGRRITGTWHNAMLKPGVTVQGSLMGANEYARSNAIEEHLRESAERMRQLALDPKFAETLSAIALATDIALRNGHKLLLCGNGGSAADAQHIAAEFMVRYQKDRRPYPAIALTPDSSVLTACSNDIGFAEVFARQVRALGHEGDMLWAFSTSGNSENVIRAARVARQRGVKVVAFTRASRFGKPNKLAKLAQWTVGVGETTAQSQELHIVATHAICADIDARII